MSVQKGFSLVQVIVAVGIVIIFVVGGYYVYTEVYSEEEAFVKDDTPVPAEPAKIIPTQAPDTNDLDQAVVEEEGTVQYMVDSAASELVWAAERIVGNSHTGSVTIQDGTLTVMDGAFVSGEFTIDMTTISESSNNSRFLTHIRSDDFFDVGTFPTSKIVLTDVERTGENSATVAGNLTILDQTHAIAFPASFFINGDNGDVTIEADITIDRTRWGIIFDSGSIFTNLGDSAIRDNVHSELTLVLEKT